jgi:putative transcriptional regulator
MVINKVREFRELCRMTQEELCAAVFVSRQTIISIEKGSYNPSIELGLKLAKCLNTTIDSLFQLEDTNE